MLKKTTRALLSLLLAAMLVAGMVPAALAAGEESPDPLLPEAAVEDAAPAEEGTGFIVAGRLDMPENEPDITEVRLELWRQPPGGGSAGGLSFFLATTTDLAHGWTFLFADEAKPIDRATYVIYTIFPEASGYPQITTHLSSVNNDLPDILIEVPKHYTLSGTITAPAGSTATTPPELSMRANGTMYWDIDISDGGPPWTYSQRITPGEASLFLPRGEGYAEKTHSFTMGESDQVENITLEQGNTITGSITLPGGSSTVATPALGIQWVSGWTSSLSVGGPKPVVTGTAPNWTYTIPNMAAGIYQLSIPGTTSFTAQQKNVTVPDDGDVTVDFTLNTGYAVGGTFHWPEDIDLTPHLTNGRNSATLHRGSSAAEPAFASSDYDSQGNFRFKTNVDNGTYTIKANIGYPDPNTSKLVTAYTLHTFTVDGRDRTDLEITLAKTYTLAGTISAPGLDLYECVLQLRDGSDAWLGNAKVTATETGSATFEFASTYPAGTYLLKLYTNGLSKLLAEEVLTLSGDNDYSNYVFVAKGRPVSNSSILGLTPPAKGEKPVAVISDDFQFTGTVAWEGALDADGNFLPDTTYVANVTLTPAAGYTLEGLPAYHFGSVSGATSAVLLPATGGDSRVLQVTFPKTAGLQGRVAFSPSMVDLSTAGEVVSVGVSVDGDLRFDDLDTPVILNAQYNPVSVDCPLTATLEKTDDRSGTLSLQTSSVDEYAQYYVRLTHKTHPEFTATLDVEIVPPLPVDPGELQPHRLITTSQTVNKRLTLNNVFLSIVPTGRDKSYWNTNASRMYFMLAPLNEKPASLDAFAEIEKAYKTILRPIPDNGLWMQPQSNDGSSIDALSRKSYKLRVKAMFVHPDGTTSEVPGLISGTFTLKVGSTPPKIKTKAIKINTYYDAETTALDREALFQNASLDGQRILNLYLDQVSLAKNANWLEPLYGEATTTGRPLEGLRLNTTLSGKRTGKLYLLAEVDGYRAPVPFTLKVTASRTVPALKLSSSSLTLRAGEDYPAHYQEQQFPQFYLLGKSKQHVVKDMPYEGVYVPTQKQIDDWVGSGRITSKTAKKYTLNATGLFSIGSFSSPGLDTLSFRLALSSPLKDSGVLLVAVDLRGGDDILLPITVKAVAGALVTAPAATTRLNPHVADSTVIGFTPKNPLSYENYDVKLEPLDEDSTTYVQTSKALSRWGYLFKTTGTKPGRAVSFSYRLTLHEKIDQQNVVSTKVIKVVVESASNITTALSRTGGLIDLTRPPLEAGNQMKFRLDVKGTYLQAAYSSGAPEFYRVIKGKNVSVDASNFDFERYYTTDGAPLYVLRTAEGCSLAAGSYRMRLTDLQLTDGTPVENSSYCSFKVSASKPKLSTGGAYYTFSKYDANAAHSLSVTARYDEFGSAKVKRIELKDQDKANMYFSLQPTGGGSGVLTFKEQPAPQLTPHRKVKSRTLTLLVYLEGNSVPFSLKVKVKVY